VKVVSNASILISLSTIGRLPLLQGGWFEVNHAKSKGIVNFTLRASRP